MYLAESEFRLLAQLPANEIRKTRCSVPPFGIDVFHDTLEGLFLAEAEFDTPLEADALAPRDGTFSSCCWKTASARSHCDSLREQECNPD